MNKKRGPFTVIGSKQVYKNPWIEVIEDKVIRPDGKEGIFAVVRDFGGGSILPMDTNGNVYIKKEYAYAIDQEEIATVAGGRDSEGESFLDAAKRELQEEAGITAGTWIDLGMVHPMTTVIWMPEHLFLAMNLTFGAARPEESIILILRAAEYLKKNKI